MIHAQAPEPPPEAVLLSLALGLLDNGHAKTPRSALRLAALSLKDRDKAWETLLRIDLAVTPERWTRKFLVETLAKTRRPLDDPEDARREDLAQGAKRGLELAEAKAKLIQTALNVAQAKINDRRFEDALESLAHASDQHIEPMQQHSKAAEIKLRNLVALDLDS